MSGDQKRSAATTSFLPKQNHYSPDRAERFQPKQSCQPSAISYQKKPRRREEPPATSYTKICHPERGRGGRLASESRDLQFAVPLPKAKSQKPHASAVFPRFCLQVARAQDFADHSQNGTTVFKILRGITGEGVHTLFALRGFKAVEAPAFMRGRETSYETRFSAGRG